MQQTAIPNPPDGLGPAPGDSHDYTVLIVDDDVDLLDLMERSLRLKYHVLKASSAPEALELLRANPVHLLVTDQYMPGMTGVQLLAAAKAEKPEVGRLLITGRTDLQDLIAAVNVGEVQHYISKPWSMGMLLGAVEQAAEKFRLSSENRRLMQVEAALRESEAAFRALIENADGPIWSVDPQYCLLASNTRFRQNAQTRLGREIARGENVLDGALDATRQEWQNYYDRGLRGDSFRIVLETVPPLAQRFVEYHFNPIVTSDGRVIGVTVWGTDITEHKQAEAELRRSEEHYRFLVDHLPAGLLVHAADGRAVLTNPKASDLLGLSPAQMQGKPLADPVWQFVREDTSPMPVDEYPAQRVFASGQPVSNQLVGIQRPAANQYIWTLAQAFPDFDAQGQVRQAVVMLTDITRRKQTEAALQASETRLRDLYRSAQRQTLEMSLLDEVRAVVAGELDLATVIRKVVEAIAETFNYPLVSLYLRQADSMVLRHQVGYENVLEEIPISKGVLGRVMRTGQPVLLGDVRADPDFLAAVPGITSEACVPLFDSGRVVGALNIESKGFELTKADLRLLAALGEQIGLALGRARLYTQVREDAATRSILLHEVNHRVKNNLSAIIGLLQIQQEHLDPEVQASHPQLFEDLTGRIRSLAAVHDMLSAASWAPLLIHELAGRIVQAAVAIAPPEPHIIVDISPSPLLVTAKLAGPLALIINELATNSLKYALPPLTPPASAGGVRGGPALRLGLEIRQNGSQVEMEYRDNGPGFPLAVLRGEEHNVGLHLIGLLGRHDLRGKIDLGNEGGAVVRLSFRAEGGEALAPAPTGPLSISGSFA